MITGNRPSGRPWRPKGRISALSEAVARLNGAGRMHERGGRGELAACPGTGYTRSVSTQTAELLEAFEALPDEEKRAFAQELLRRSLPFDSGPLEDAEIARASDDLFAALEREEDAAHTR